MQFTTAQGVPVIINPDHVVAVQPTMDPKTGTPIIGQATILTDLPPPNIPGAGHVSIAVRGEYREVALALRLIFEHEIEEAPSATPNKE